MRHEELQRVAALVASGGIAAMFLQHDVKFEDLMLAAKRLSLQARTPLIISGVAENSPTKYQALLRDVQLEEGHLGLIATFSVA